MPVYTPSCIFKSHMYIVGESVIPQIITQHKAFRALISCHPRKTLHRREGRHYCLHSMHRETKAQGGKKYNSGAACTEDHRQTGTLPRKRLKSWGSGLWRTGSIACEGSPDAEAARPGLGSQLSHLTAM